MRSVSLIQTDSDHQIRLLFWWNLMKVIDFWCSCYNCVSRTVVRTSIKLTSIQVGCACLYLGQQVRRPHFFCFEFCFFVRCKCGERLPLHLILAVWPQSSRVHIALCAIFVVSLKISIEIWLHWWSIGDRRRFVSVFQPPKRFCDRLSILWKRMALSAVD